MSKEGNSDSSQGQEGQGQEKPTAQNPDPDVKPPKFDLVTESYDPSKVKAKQTKVDVPPTEKKEKE